ncbi:alpha/beta fold hydrolase [Alishewanella tabrizica]|uniref:Sigma factor SigB regulation protein RsbQ n=1 Tax=Alishewanella tabrizica TaxID=671278 RepID=A0ABQ2WL91_9ALTE|nr:alpha/beta hydrolase [Alishewanella tabrizica]GGW59069.1 sigma factor SigB regulation protein RsbQ [Alishewanella tabrizica]
MSVLQRNNVRVLGKPSDPVLLFAHGFGCNQSMWDSVASAFIGNTYQILFDYVGSGQSDLRCYQFERYANLQGYAQDVIEICDALGLERDVIFVGHSVSCSIGALAAVARPNLFREMIFLGASPCFLNDPPHYSGGFDKDDLEGLLALMNQNYVGWAEYLAPVVAGPDNNPEIAGELSNSFCSTDPVIAQHFARATFFADNRDDFAKVTVPSLILQHQDDVLASVAVGEFLHKQLKHSQLKILDVAGHAAHMSHPGLVITAIQDYLKERDIL